MMLVPSKLSPFKIPFVSIRSLISRNKNDNISMKELSHRKIASRFANLLHGYAHFYNKDKKKIWEFAGFLNPILLQTLKSIYDRVTSCKKTGQPKRSKNLSLNRISVNFNGNIQVAFFFISEMKISISFTWSTFILHNPPHRNTYNEIQRAAWCCPSFQVSLNKYTWTAWHRVHRHLVLQNALHEGTFVLQQKLSTPSSP